MLYIIVILNFLTLIQCQMNLVTITPNHPDPLFNGSPAPPAIAARIVGGEEARPNSLPYQAALVINTKNGVFFCGGSLISTMHVLTAAHCVDGAEKVEVILGAHNIRELEPTQRRYITSKFIIHPEWDSYYLTNDIALVVLPEHVPLSRHIQVVALPSLSEARSTFRGMTGIISGWGRASDENKKISNVLRLVETDVISNHWCNVQYLGIIKSTQICTSGDLGKNTCNGDSGGPLVVNNRQVGIVSFGVAFGCQVGWPAVFTRVGNYLVWISKSTGISIRI
ncbi:brachyurin-like [Agrilus planipennis]|uniref:Brachyurin-like n=1 Tax=Agrilus planipennis TaxID=224129 RepID=A0A1W4WDD7_AGRPL|nr:brachyurin-like [Agrilus planipennis]